MDCKCTLKRPPLPPLPSDPPDPNESRRPPSFLAESGVECGLRPGAVDENDPDPASVCPSLPLSARLLCGLDLRAFSPNRLRPLDLEDEEPLTAPASLLKTGEAEEAAGRNQSAQDRQGVGGALRRSSMPASNTSSCSSVAFTWTQDVGQSDRRIVIFLTGFLFAEGKLKPQDIGSSVLYASSNQSSCSLHLSRMDI